ncbi:MAG: copper resistance protein CopC [Sporolactobacillus sp.]|jgi:copper transport protein|nr:copper resistance protein CopC [Sporolactobacillus sp.]
MYQWRCDSLVIHMTKRKICWLLILVFLFLLLADRTSAHAYLVRSNPAANQRVSSNINNVRIQFNEPIQPTFFTLAVVDQNGRRVDAHQARIDKRRRNVLQNTVKTPLAEGFYRIKWKVISADGHPVDGTIAFQVGHPNTRSNQAPALAAGNDWPGVDRIVIKWMLYGGLSLYLGILVFFTLIYRRRDPFIFKRRSLKFALRLAIALLGSGILLLLPLQVTINADVNWLHALDGRSVGLTLWSTSFGTVWFLQLTLLLLCLLPQAILVRTRSRKAAACSTSLLMALAALIALTEAFSGHAVGVKVPARRFWAVTADFLHVSAASLWIGSLVSLWLLLPGILQKDTPAAERKQVYRKLIQRFSPFAVILVAILLLSGLIGSLIHLPTFRSLYTSAYGRLIIGKGGLLLIMLLFALYSFLRIRGPRIYFLGKSVIGELGVGLIALLAAAVLTTISPPPPAPEAAKASVLPPAQKSSQIKEKEYQLVLKVTPLKVGTNRVSLDVRNHGKRATDLQQVVLTIRSLDMDMGTTKFQVPLTKLGEGIPVKHTFIMRGRYVVHVHILNQSFQDTNQDLIVIIH